MENAILIFVGCDKTGKSTISRSMIKRTNKYVCIDRLFPCQMIYGEINNKKENILEEKIFEVEKFLSKSTMKFIYVWIDCDTETIKKRFEETNEKDIDPSQIDLVRSMYLNYFKTHKDIQMIYINTSNFTVEDCLDKIDNFVKSILLD